MVASCSRQRCWGRIPSWKSSLLFPKMRQQRLRERTVVAAAILRRRSGRRGKGVDRAVGAADAPKPRDNRSRRILADGRRAMGRVVATGIEQNNATRRDFGRSGEDLLEGHGGRLQGCCGIEIGIDRQQKILSADLQAMAGEIH